MKRSGKRSLAFILWLVLCIGLLQIGVVAAEPLAVTGITASKTTASVGSSITWTASASGGSGTLQYYFIVYKDGTKVKTRAYSTSNTFTYTPAEAGSYKARVYVKDTADAKVYKLSAGVTVTEATPLSITSIKASKTTANVGSAITWTATASGGSGTLQYYFIVYKDGTKVTTRAYSTANTFTYTPTEAGTYKARVYVKDSADAKVNKLSAGTTVKAIELDAEQIYSKCSPAVFYIEVADKSGKVYASGSGFFISSDGTAVTNYHVIDGAYSATITLSSGATYKVAGVYDYNEYEDWAILKINGSGFPYLGVGNASTVVGGAKCYAIGSPQGLQNTISEGIISNPSQDLGGMSFIQTTAAISHGSSGGALINKYGQVIGITTGIYEEGENLGFAVPVSYINGYSHSQCTALSTLFPGASNSDMLTAQNAKALLAWFVINNYNHESTDCFEYTETETTANGSISRCLAYDYVNDEVFIQRREVYKNGVFYITMFFNPDSLIQVVGFSYYSNQYSSKPVFRSYSYLYAPSFYGNNLKFTDVIIDTGFVIEDGESIASIQVQDCLLFTDYIFYKYISNAGDFGVYLFGFTNYSAN